MQGVTKAASDRVNITRTVVSSVDVHGPSVASVLTAILFPSGPPANLTVADFLTALRDALDRGVTELADADVAHAAELADDEAPRAARDNGVSSLREQIIGLRNTFTSVYGSSILAAYALSAETPTEPDLLVQRAITISGLLKSRPITEKPRQIGITIDAAALASAIDTTVGELRTALADVRREEREAQLTLARRNDAFATWGSRYQGVADIMTGVYELCGRNDLADRVRPTARRRAGLAEEADAAPTNGGATAGAGGAAPTPGSPTPAPVNGAPQPPSPAPANGTSTKPETTPETKSG